MRKTIKPITTIFAVLGLLTAMSLHFYPGSHVVMKAFIDKGVYAYITQSSHSQWLRMLSRYNNQQIVLPSDVGILNTFGGVTERLVSRVNINVNSISYADDEDNYGKVEYFATPREMIDRGMGDCEDYAILKMHLLLTLGFPADDMFLLAGIYDDGVYVGGHAVLGIRVQGIIYVLDNMRNTIIPLHEYRQFEPMAGINWFGFHLMGILGR